MHTDLSIWHALEDCRGPGLLVLTAPACGACRRLDRLLQSLDLSLPIIRANAERCGGLIEELEVFHLPAVFPVHAGEPGPPLQFELTAASLQGALQDAGLS